ncbi:LPS assembly lipoprotein LptE [Thiobacillus denitrificans]|uniref:LPS-assembly lipoprotein LptE n=1 Tax=Thiobacillus denitrificans TaxID=36861 RepID=A0A125BCW4_THIDE|nr:LPS assembly lipoprotein LptE [Thiobacillus denitrificans]KVW96797.1 lipoprotein B transmembrane [Thiobacillus denitrificans]
MNRRLFLAAFPAVLAAGCGFKLRRFEDIPFASLYIDAPHGGAVAQRIRSALTSSKQTRLAASAGEAEAVLVLGPEARSKVILSLSGAGRVTEYRLGLQLTYRISDKDGRTLAAAEVIELSRDITYDDTQVLAKAAEEQLLYRDMEDSAARRIMRRLQSIGPGPAS